MKRRGDLAEREKEGLNGKSHAIVARLFEYRDYDLMQEGFP